MKGRTLLNLLGAIAAVSLTTGCQTTQKTEHCNNSSGPYRMKRASLEEIRESVYLNKPFYGVDPATNRVYHRIPGKPLRNYPLDDKTSMLDIYPAFFSRDLCPDFFDFWKASEEKRNRIIV